MPLAHDLQNIFIRELVSFKPVNESDVDQLLYDVERIYDFYIKAGSEEDLNLSRWVKACILQNLPDKVVSHLVIEPKKLESIEEMQHLANTLSHDHWIGMLRGQPGPMLYPLEPESPDRPRDETQTENPHNATPKTTAM